MSNFNLRLVRPDEMPFVYAAWIRSSNREDCRPARVYKARDSSRLITLYMDQKIWEALLSKRIATLQDNIYVAESEGSLIGFISHNSKTLNYVYVESKFRRHGLAAEMLKLAGIGSRPVITHWTPDFHIWSKGSYIWASE